MSNGFVWGFASSEGRNHSGAGEAGLLPLRAGNGMMSA